MNNIYPIKMIIILSFLFIIIILYMYFNNFSGPQSYLNNDWGTFGDYLAGTIGTIFSFASFILLLYTLKQSKEIANQQNYTHMLQRFEGTFFQLINLYHQVIETLTFNQRNKRDSIDNAIEVFFEIIKTDLTIEKFTILNDELQKAYDEDDIYRDRSNAAFRPVEKLNSLLKLHANIIISFEHYIKTVSTIFKHFNNYNNSIDTKPYLTILLSQLSSNEKLFIVSFVNEHCFDLKEIDIELIINENVASINETYYNQAITKNKEIKLLKEFKDKCSTSPIME